MSFPMLDENYLVPVDLLKPCKLWRGSHEELDFTYGGGLKVYRLSKKIQSLMACDDLTPDEQEYLDLLKKTYMRECIRRGAIR